MPTPRRPEVPDTHRMVVTADAMQCVRVPIDELRMSKTQQSRSRQRSRPVELCPDVHTCTNNACAFVHPRNAATFKSWWFRPVHANLQVVAADDENVRYPRCTGPGSVTTLCPNTKAVVRHHVPIGHLLQTLGTKDVTNGQSLELCPHFYFNQACSSGVSCRLTHVVTVEPRLSQTSDRLQWAPKKIVASDRRTSDALARSLSGMSDSGSAHSATPPTPPPAVDSPPILFVYRFDPYAPAGAVRRVL